MGKRIKRCVLVLWVLALCIITISNSASAATGVSANIPVYITLNGTKPSAPETFVVEVTAADPTYPMPTGTDNGLYRMEMEGTKPGTVNIVFDKLGVFDYTVRQIAGDNADCDYDDAVYHVTAFVTNSQTDSGYDLSVVVCRNGENEKRGDILFENVYAKPCEVTISAVKTLDGTSPKNGAFTFELLDSDGKPVKTAANIGKNVSFGTLRFDKIGTYAYQLKEVPGGDRKIIYDEAVYDVIVEVTKDDHGDYAASLTYRKDQAEYTGVPAFENETRTDPPKTGDNFQIWRWITLMGLSLTGSAALAILSRKRKIM